MFTLGVPKLKESNLKHYDLFQDKAPYCRKNDFKNLVRSFENTNLVFFLFQ
jgi:hypothetical protein